jgi:hypothetical protein
MDHRYIGSCHCGGVVFEATLDLDEGVRRCNCTYCFKTGYKKAFAYGDNVEVTEGEALLGHYVAQPSSWPPGESDHCFCTRCGTQLFSRAKLDIAPFNGWFHAVNVSVLDVAPEVLDRLPIIYEDGLHDRQTEAPALTHYL